jgi:hypothetical protein
MASAAVPILAGLPQWNRLQGNLKLVLLVPIISGLADVTSLVLMNFSINTWPVINLFFIAQPVLFFLIINSERKSIFLNTLIFLSLILALLNYALYQSPKTFNSYTSYLWGILIIISAVNFLYQLLAKMPVEKVQMLPLFWVAFGVLIYYGGTLFLFLFNNYLIANLPEDHQLIWILHNLLNITKNGFLFIALWMNYKSKTYP